MVLTPVMQQFVVHWGEMGTRWGINRTMAQIHALLYLSPRPLNAEQIAATLSVARSNVSSSLRELQGWGIVRLTQVLGDRRDYFESMTDVWEMFQQVLDERKRREIDPTLAVLRECLAQAEAASPADRHVTVRLKALLEFFETTSSWYAQMRRLPAAALLKFFKLGGKLQRMLGR